MESVDAIHESANTYLADVVGRIGMPFSQWKRSSHRKILLALNIFVAFLSVGVATVSVMGIFVTFSFPSITSGWTILLENAVVYFYLFSVSLIGLRGSYLVSLDLLLRYFWGIAIILGPLVVVEFVTFQFLINIRSSYQHSWSDKSFTGIRYGFCQPTNSYNTYCDTPFFGSGYNVTFNITSYCLKTYQSVLCETTRNAACNDAVEFSKIGYLCVCIVGLVCFVLSVYGIYISYSVITLKIFTQSMNDNISYLLFVSALTCAVIVGYGWYFQSFVLSYYFNTIPYYFIAASGAQLIAIPFGIITDKFKSRNGIIAYMIYLILTICLLGIICGYTIYYALHTDLVWNPTPADVGIIACSRSLSGCCCCDSPPSSNPNYNTQCPEWSQNDLTRLLSLDLEILGFTAGFCSFAPLCALVIAYMTQRNLKDYKFDFI